MLEKGDMYHITTSRPQLVLAAVFLLSHSAHRS